VGEVPAGHHCVYEGCNGTGEKVFSTFGIGHGGTGYDGDNVLIPCKEITKQLPPHIRKGIDRLKVMRKAVRDSEAHPGEN